MCKIGTISLSFLFCNAHFLPKAMHWSSRGNMELGSAVRGNDKLRININERWEDDSFPSLLLLIDFRP